MPYPGLGIGLQVSSRCPFSKERCERRCCRHKSTFPPMRTHKVLVRTQRLYGRYTSSIAVSKSVLIGHSASLNCEIISNRASPCRDPGSASPRLYALEHNSPQHVLCRASTSGRSRLLVCGRAAVRPRPCCKRSPGGPVKVRSDLNGHHCDSAML